MKKHFLLLGLMVALPASAEGVYVFGDAGQRTSSIDFLGGVYSRTETSYSIGLGYEATQTFSFEVAYRDLGEDTFSDEYEKSVSEGSAVQVSVVAKYPISPIVNVFGRLGVADLSDKTTYQYYDYPEYDESDSSSKTKAYYGVGASYAVDEKLSFRGEYSRYAEWEDVTTSALTIGAVYKF